MNPQLPNGFHQALVSSTVFLAGITLGYLKFIVVDSSAEDWSFFTGISALLAVAAILIQVETLRRALQIQNDDSRRFARTVGYLISSVWLLIASGASLVLAHWWRPFPGLLDWLN